MMFGMLQLEKSINATCCKHKKIQKLPQTMDLLLVLQSVNLHQPF